MTKTAVRKLTKGQEVFNTDTGEVAFFTTAIGTVGTVLFVEGMDRFGRTHVWSHTKTEQV